jgi:hypothetical protein
LENISKQIAELKELEFDYTLVEGGNGTGKKNKCGTCGAEGHSTRTCPNKKK